MEELIHILLKWFKWIMVVCTLAITGSIVLALSLPEIYQSSATFLPTNPHYMNRENLFSTGTGRTAVNLFGGKNDLNRLMTIAQSRKLRSFVVEKFNLYEHYEIDQDDPQKAYWLSVALDDVYNIVKLPSNMLRVEVQDEDPVFAADMTNAIVAQLDVLNKEVVNEKRQDMLGIYKAKVAEYQASVNILKDSLQSVIKTNPADTVTTNMLDLMIQDALGEYLKVNSIYDKHKTSLEQEYSSLYIIESAVPAVKRVKPVRWLIVVTSALVSFLAMMFIVVFIERFQKFKLSAEHV